MTSRFKQLRKDNRFEDQVKSAKNKFIKNLIKNLNHLGKEINGFLKAVERNHGRNLIR